ncbi:cryptococcal mannosyltransferase 1-domain-containing protein, partial [Elsinoe ampelina]
DSSAQQEESIFIASLSWNDADELMKFWVHSLLDTVEALGRNNVYISILESGSWDGAGDILMSLAGELDERGVRNRIHTANVTHLDILEGTIPAEGGWITTKNGPEVRRIPYLARLRNQVMDDMLRVEEETGKRFDKVLWLNDVKFSPSDVLTLLRTHHGSYAAACALDYRHPHQYYDTFATRDISGNEIPSQHWPYFADAASQNLLTSGRPVPVQACWGGMLPIPWGRPSDAHPGLRFRAIPDSLSALHLEASESCLIHTDNPLSPTRGVFLNPRVRVAYSAEVYAAMHTGRHGGARVPLRTRVRGAWDLRLARWMGGGGRRERRLRGEGSEGREGGEDVEGKGRVCLIDEQQVLRWNGWAHV